MKSECRLGEHEGVQLDHLRMGIQAPPNPCASSRVLTALRNENQAVIRTNGCLERDAVIIDTDIADLLEIIVLPNPC